MVRPVHGDHLDVVLTVAQQQNAVDGASRIGGQRGGLGFTRYPTRRLLEPELAIA
jgi:hypothetical protein